MRLRTALVCALPAILLSLPACEESPTGRTQVTLVPDAQMAQLGAQSFRELLKSQPIDTDPSLRETVSCIVRTLVDALPQPHGDWSVALFDDATPNAFALPGGYIGVNAGMLRVARTQDQLAAVIAHEIAHVIADHGNERLTQELAVQGGLMLVDLLVAEPGSVEQEVLRQALGIGAQYGLLLPYSRAHEREADRIGRDLMAEAGFDPRATLALWRNMAAASSNQPLEILSTHPTHENRQEELADGMVQAVNRFAEARRAGRRPNCTP